jgi:Rrf2 family protein
MAVNTQFSVAVHIMAVLGYTCSGETTSASMAASVNTSASFVRRVLAKLSKCGLVNTTTGKAGACRLGRDARDISLLDIYRAVGAPRAVTVHRHPEIRDCPVSCHIKEALDRALAKSQKAMEAGLDGTTLAQIVSQMKRS